jgi:YD repeat-containing protein
MLSRVLVLALISFCWFPVLANAKERGVEPKVYYGLTQYTIGISPSGTQFTSPAAAMADIQAFYLDSCPYPPNCSYLSNIRPAPFTDVTNGVAFTYFADRKRYEGGQLVGDEVIVIGIQPNFKCPKSLRATKTTVLSAPTASPSITRVTCVPEVAHQDPEKSCKIGNPILLGSNIKIQDERDYQSSAPEGLSFTRHYRSDKRQWSHNYDATGANFSSLGNQSNAGCLNDVTDESDPVAYCFKYVSESDDPVDFTIFRPSGFQVLFSGPLNSITADPIVNDRLYPILNSGSNVVSGWYLYRSSDNAFEEYDDVKRLLTVTMPNGRATRLTYVLAGGSTHPIGAPTCLNSSVVPAGKLGCVTDPNGRQINLSYDAKGRFNIMIDPNGGVTTYEYDGPTAVIVPPSYGFPVLTVPSGSGSVGGSTTSVLEEFLSNMITKVSYADGTSRTYHYNEQDQTGGVNLPYALTGITDERGNRFATFKYGEDGKAVSTEHAGGVERYVFASRSSVIDPLGSQRSYSYDEKQGQLFVVSATQPGGSGCAAAYQNLYRDSNSNITYAIDFNGNKTTYKYDLNRNLETSRIEALGKPEQRTITTQWHPDFRYPIQINTPLKVTKFVFNGQVDPIQGGVASCVPAGTSLLPLNKIRPVLCKRVEQPTGDIDGTAGSNAPAVGTARVWSYSYTVNGQVASVDGPRTDAGFNDVTTFQYYAAASSANAVGDLWKVTNAKGFTTEFLEYDLRGNATKIKDPNGLISAMVFDERNRLKSRIDAVGTALEQKVLYDYWPTGKVKQVTLPDGSRVNLGYDDAQRLTDITDSIGNKIVYTLDPMGNRIREDVQDAQGALSKVVVRVFDALSRLQEVRGAQQ